MKDVETQVKDLFSRGVGEFVDPDSSLKEKLLKKAKGEYQDEIVIKFGVDPTRPDIHLGHAAVLRKLRTLQDLGCKVVFLVGDFTARIGDPTGKSKVRPEIEQGEVEHNMNTYLEQVGKILRTDPISFSWIRNSDWFYSVADLQPQSKGRRLKLQGDIMGVVDADSYIGKAVLYKNTRMQHTHLKRKTSVSITLWNLLWTLRHITHGRLIQRDMFQERISKNEELYMHEMLYPVLQGIDSYVINQIYGSCDLEIGGTDQTFNMLVGRDVMKFNNQKPQAVLSVKLLEGTDGKEKMSKSLDNYIGITDTPSDTYGKIMSIPDTSLKNYFELCTYTPEEDIKKIEEGIKTGKMHPKEIKMQLAHEIVAMYHGETEADKAEESFKNTFSKKETPGDIAVTVVEKGTLLVDALLKENLIGSKSEFRRLCNEGAIKKKTEEGWQAISWDANLKVVEPMILKVGKIKFIQIELS